MEWTIQSRYAPSMNGYYSGASPRSQARRGRPATRHTIGADEDWEWARRVAASLPPLTDRQRDILALLLRKRR